MKPLKLYVPAALAACLVFAAFAAHAGPNLVIQGDTVYDKKTDRTWQRCSAGLRWNPATSYCVGVKKTMTFDEADSAGYGGSWRMPTIEELKTLIEKEKQDGLYIDVKAFPDTGDGGNTWYWSSTSRDGSTCWLVVFGAGQAAGGNGDRSATNAVRLVRGGQ